MEVTHTKLELKEYYALVREQLGRGLIDAAKFVIDENVDGIEKKKTWAGGSQKPNQDPVYNKMKLEEVGHLHPLKFGKRWKRGGKKGKYIAARKTDLLSYKDKYKINNKPLSTGYANLRAKVSKTKIQVFIRPPKNKERIIEGLRARGYIYWGFGNKMQQKTKVYLLNAIKRANAKFKSTSRSGSSLTSIAARYGE